MTEFIKMGGPYPTRSRRRSNAEPLQFEDAEYVPSPVFEDVVHAVNPEFPDLGEVTFLPGELKPRWMVDRELAAAAAPPEPTPAPTRRKGNRGVKASEQESKDLA